MKDDSQKLKEAFPDFKFSHAVVPELDGYLMWYVLKKENIAIFISYYPEDEVEEGIYLTSIVRKDGDIIMGFEFTLLEDLISSIKEELFHVEQK